MGSRGIQGEDLEEGVVIVPEPARATEDIKYENLLYQIVAARLFVSIRKKTILRAIPELDPTRLDRTAQAIDCMVRFEGLRLFHKQAKDGRVLMSSWHIWCVWLFGQTDLSVKFWDDNGRFVPCSSY